jgi:hypothetical protein
MASMGLQDLANRANQIVVSNSIRPIKIFKIEVMRALKMEFFVQEIV